MNPLVSIITVNYRQASVTIELLKTINTLKYYKLEVILVDNGRGEDFDENFRSIIPNIRIIHSEKNLGFAEANNLGIKQAGGEYILLLNNDTEVEGRLIEDLLHHFDDDTAAISPVIHYYEDQKRIQFAGNTVINPFTGRNKVYSEISGESKLKETAYFHGAAVMIRTSAIEECGLMPEEFFLYYEELSWSESFKSRGYKIKVALNCKVLHKESVSTGKGSPLKVYYHNRNRLKFLKKHSHNVQFVFFLIYYFSLPFLRQMLTLKGAHKKALLESVSDFFLAKSGATFSASI